MSRRPTDGTETHRRVSRRRWLAGLCATGAATLAGCAGEEENADESAADDTAGSVDVGSFPRFGVDDMYGSSVARSLARTAFEASEYDYGFDGDKLVTPSGEQMTLDIYHSAGQETSQLTAEFIAQELTQNLGLEVTVEAIDGTRFTNEYWTGSPEGGTDIVNGEEVEWENPTPQNPGPQSVTSNEGWDLSVVFGLNTYPLNPLTNRVFFDGPTAVYNPVGYYPEFDAAGLFTQAQEATSRESLREAFIEIFENLAREQPYVTLLLGDDIIGYNPSLTGPTENFSNGWDFPAWYAGEPTVSGSYDTVSASGFTTLNPLYNTESGAGSAIGRVLDQGYTFDTDQSYVPLLYDMSTTDGAVWTFDVRETLRFSEPYGQLTAADFVYLIQEVHQSDWANTVAASSWSGVEVEQTGEFSFEARLESPSLLWPETFDPLLYPIPRGLLEPYVDTEDVDGLQQDDELLNLSFSGNLGPFTLEAWNRGSGTTYARNDAYYLRETAIGPDRIERGPLFEEASISVIKEQASRLGALETGEADAAGIPPEQFQSYQENDSVSVKQIPTPFNRILSVNQRDNGWQAGPGNLFQITAFRQAIAAAIGKRDLIQGVYRGLAEPHFTWQPRWSAFYPPTE